MDAPSQPPRSHVMLLCLSVAVAACGGTARVEKHDATGGMRGHSDAAVNAGGVAGMGGNSAGVTGAGGGGATGGDGDGGPSGGGNGAGGSVSSAGGTSTDAGSVDLCKR